MDIGAVLLDALRSSVAIQAAVFALAAVGLNLQFGYTGLLNFGLVAFMAAGAYGLALSVEYGLPFWLGVIIGAASAVVVALLYGLPALRLRADYLAITTIAVGEMIRLILRSNTAEPVTRGVFGVDKFANTFYAINPIPAGRYGWAQFSFTERGLWAVAVTWALVAIASLIVWLLVRSPWGRVLKALRDDEDAARSLGKNVFNYKLQALIIGGVIAAFAGLMRAVDAQAVRPDFFLTVVTFAIFTVVILGGTGTIWGPIVGAVVYWFVISFSEGILRELADSGIISPEFMTDQDIGAIRFMGVGLALMLLVIFRPQGIVGRKEDGLLE